MSYSLENVLSARWYAADILKPTEKSCSEETVQVTPVFHSCTEWNYVIIKYVTIDSFQCIFLLWWKVVFMGRIFGLNFSCKTRHKV